MDIANKQGTYNACNVRMSQRGEHLRFTLEPRATIGICGPCVGEHLDRDLARQAGVSCAIDLAHAPCAKQRDDLITAETSAGGQRQQVQGL
jgi:hypothetical protein